MIKLKIKIHTIRILHTDAQTHKLTSRAFKKKLKIQTSNYTKLNSQDSVVVPKLSLRKL